METYCSGTTWECHAEKNTIYKPGHGDKPISMKCNLIICGGHTVKGELNREVVCGSDASGICIIPICNAHNVCHEFGKAGTGYYMKTDADLTVLLLKGKIGGH
jgi:hypothetical protein